MVFLQLFNLVLALGILANKEPQQLFIPTNSSPDLGLETSTDQVFLYWEGGRVTENYEPF